MRSRSLKLWLYTLLALGGAATAVKAGLNYLSDDFKNRGELESLTLEEARDRGILVKALTAEPNELAFDDRRIRVTQAWIEERSLPAHRFVWLPGERRTGGWRLHVTVSPLDVLAAGDFKIVTAGHEKQLYFGQISSRGERVFVLILDRPDVSGLLLRVVSTGAEDVERPFIQLTPVR